MQPKKQISTRKQICFSHLMILAGVRHRFSMLSLRKRLATYARGKKTGQSNMQVNFTITAQQNKQEYQLILCAQDDDSEKKCPIRIELNGNLLFHGANPFQRFGWNRKTFKIPQGILKEGNNTLSICNIADSGNVSGPPFLHAELCGTESTGKVTSELITSSGDDTKLAAGRFFMYPPRYFIL